MQAADFSELVANRAAVHQALGVLPVQQRTAVWATKALDYTQDECAVVMQKWHRCPSRTLRPSRS